MTHSVWFVTGSVAAFMLSAALGGMATRLERGASAQLKARTFLEECQAQGEPWVRCLYLKCVVDHLEDRYHVQECNRFLGVVRE